MTETLFHCKDALWTRLHAALRGRGLRYEPAGGGLTLVDVATGQSLARSSLVGPAT